MVLANSKLQKQICLLTAEFGKLLMSMTMQLRRAGQDILTDLSSEEQKAFKFVYPSDLEDLAYRDGSILDIDKAWHAINFLLSRVNKGTVWRSINTVIAKVVWNSKLPSGFLLAGAEVGADLGYGPVRILLPSEVSEVSAFLASLPDDFIESELDFVSLRKAGVYPMMWDREDPDDIQYVSSHFRNLRKFVSTAARNNEGFAQVLI